MLTSTTQFGTILSHSNSMLGGLPNVQSIIDVALVLFAAALVFFYALSLIRHK